MDTQTKLLIFAFVVIIFVLLYKCNATTNTPVEIKIEKLEPLTTCSGKSCDSKAKCSVKTCGAEANGLHPILDPEFNMREVAKQCLLLEDHINNKKKRCIDCIKKHFLMVDGLLEEAVSLEKDNIKRDNYRDLYLKWVDIEKEYVNNAKEEYNIDNISKSIRLFRKPLANEYFDLVSEY